MAASISIPKLVSAGDPRKLLSELGEGEMLSRCGCDEALCGEADTEVLVLGLRSSRGVLGADGVRRCRAVRVESPRTKVCLRDGSILLW